jgi:uncharacterized protein YbjQ (UPF0145 family)
VPIWPFKGESDAEKARKLRIADDIQALENGDLPLSARERLTALAENGDFFTSDLTVNEFALAKEAGYEPLGLVVGSAFYKVAFGAYYNGLWGPTNAELINLTAAETAARNQAVLRMRQEAAILGAHGVIGVRLKAGKYDWATGLTEFTAVGTAIRVPGRPATTEPFTSDLTGQEFWKLHQAGYWPVGLCFGICVYYLIGNFWAQTGTKLFDPSTWANTFRNIELEGPTMAMDFARHTAMRRLSDDARQHHAEGVTDMRLDLRTEERSVGSGSSERKDLVLTFMAVGTAIVTDSTPVATEPAKTLTMIDLRAGSNRILNTMITGPVGGE